jgi:molybdopterin converting factor small subunit
MSTVTLRYWAAAKQAAGVAEETISAETLAAALEVALSAREQHAVPGAPDGLRAVLARSSFLVDGTPVGGRAPETVALREAAVVEVLPPFAGG